MKDPGGYIGEALVSCGAIKPKKRVTAREAAEKYAASVFPEETHVDNPEHKHAKYDFLKGVAWQKRQAKREGK